MLCHASLRGLSDPPPKPTPRGRRVVNRGDGQEGFMLIDGVGSENLTRGVIMSLQIRKSFQIQYFEASGAIFLALSSFQIFGYLIFLEHTSKYFEKRLLNFSKYLVVLSGVYNDSKCVLSCKPHCFHHPRAASLIESLVHARRSLSIALYGHLRAG